jgi:hypothetical protein
MPDERKDTPEPRMLLSRHAYALATKVLLTVPALPTRKIAERTHKINLPQVGAKRLDKIELAVRALPQHEVT